MAGLESQNFALQWLSRLYLNTHLSDIAMTIDDEKIPCHRIVLAASSPYFEQCLFGERFMGDELMLDTSKESFLAALKFMYTGAVDIDRIDEDPVIDLFSLSHLLQIRPLVSLVEARLNAIEISANNVGKMYSVVSANNADTLLNKCWQFIEQNSENVITDMVTFSKFPYDLILEIVKRDTFFAAEIDIFHALVNWRKNNGNVDLTEVLNFLRLELIDAFSFNTHIRSTKLLSDDQYFNAHVKKPFGPRRKPEIPSTSNESELNKVHNENTESLQSPSNLDEKVDVLSFDNDHEKNNSEETNVMSNKENLVNESENVENSILERQKSFSNEEFEINQAKSDDKIPITNVNTSESCSCAQIPQNTPNSEDLLSLSAVLLVEIAGNYEDDSKLVANISELSHYVSAMNHEQKAHVVEFGAIKTMFNILGNRIEFCNYNAVVDSIWNLIQNLTGNPFLMAYLPSFIIKEIPENCDEFFDNLGIEYIFNCIERFKEESKFMTNVLNILGNMVICEHLRTKLLEPKMVNICKELLVDSQLEQSLAAARIVAFLLSKKSDIWNLCLPEIDRTSLDETLFTTVSNWKIETKRSFSFASFKPLFELLQACNMNGVKFWALWEITNSTILESERYCPMLLAEDGIQILKQLSLTNQMIDLNNLLMNQIEKWQKEQMIDENAKSERNECD